MKTIIQTQHFTLEETLNDFLTSKLTELKQYNPDIISGLAYLEIDKTETINNKICKIKLETPEGFLSIKKQCPTFEEAINQTIDELEKHFSNQKTQTMNEIIKTIYVRRSVRKYKDKIVEKELIDQLLDAGKMAPSAINKQPWKFYVVTNKNYIHLFSKEIGKEALKSIPQMGIKNIIKTAVANIPHLAHGIDFIKAPDPVFHGAPVVIFITAPKDNEWASLDIGMCSQNIMLAAKSLGLDSCPVGFGKFIMKTKSYSVLNIPAKEQVLLSIIIGYGDETPEIHERKKDNVIYIA